MKSDEGLLAELKEATEGLTFMSESDYPFEVLHWKGAAEVNAEYLRELEGLSADAPVKVTSVDEFFKVAASEAEWKSKEAITTARRYQALVQLLEENLTDLKVYRIGEINISVYVIGKLATANWIGISTQVVET